LLDSIHPNRLSLKSWMIKNKYDGETIEETGWNLKQIEEGERNNVVKRPKVEARSSI